MNFSQNKMFQLTLDLIRPDKKMFWHTHQVNFGLGTCSFEFIVQQV